MKIKTSIQKTAFGKDVYLDFLHFEDNKFVLAYWRMLGPNYKWMISSSYLNKNKLSIGGTNFARQENAK